MNYTVLTRKWRPQTFNEIVGQEHILTMLTNALELNRLHHAYLFTGTRGVGKTSLARILAKCLNCESGPTANPCGNCSACTAIDNGKFLDLLEIDAASRTKVEDTRELLDNVQYAPTQGRYKIYLIDEVHMLSGHSFNALLKTLEEPPAHVKFLLATTDPKKLPITILSRCLQFNLKRVPIELITQQLATICTTEKVPFTTDALIPLAQAADGSMRDALSLLDQAIAFSGNNITLPCMQRLLGNIEQTHIVALLQAISAQDGSQLLREINVVAEHAPDFQQLLESVLTYLHHIALAQVVLTNATAEVIALATALTPEDVQLFYQIGLIGRRDLTLAPTPQQGFEMVMLRMLAFKPISAGTDTVKPDVKAIATKATPPAKPNLKPVDRPTAWPDILAQLKLTGMTFALASNCELKQFDNQHAQFELAKNHQPLLNKNSQDRLTTALTAHFQQPITVTIRLSDSELNTSAKLTAEQKKHRHATAVDAIHNDKKVQHLMAAFDATIDVDSIKAIDPTK